MTKKTCLTQQKNSYLLCIRAKREASTPWNRLRTKGVSSHQQNKGLGLHMPVLVGHVTTFGNSVS